MAKTAEERKADRIRARAEQMEALENRAGTRVTLENQVTEGLSLDREEDITPPATEKTDQEPEAPGKGTEGQEEGKRRMILKSSPSKVPMRTYIVEWFWSGTCFCQHFHASDPDGLLKYVGRVLGGQDARIILDYDPAELADVEEVDPT